MSTRVNDVNDSSVSTEQTIESALKTHRLRSEFERTSGDIVKFEEITWDENRDRCIKANVVSDTYMVKTTIFGEIQIDEFDTASNAVEHIQNNKIYDIGTDVERVYEPSHENMISDSVKDELSQFEDSDTDKIQAVRAVEHLSEVTPRDIFNPLSVFTTEEEYPDTIVYDIKSGEYTSDSDIPTAESNPQYDELISALEICNTLDIVESIEVDKYEHRITFTVTV